MTLRELCDEISRNGFKKILILNAHGGNVPFLTYFLRAQAYRKTDYATMWAWCQDTSTLNTKPENLLRIVTERKEDFPMITEEDIKVLEGYVEKNPKGWGGGHADFSEAALVMATRPELVHEDMYEAEFSGSTGRWKGIPRLSLENAWYANNPQCYCGYAPHGCSKSIGQAMMKINAEEVAEMVKALKEKDFDCVKIANLEPKAD
jgi:creatinine amidohydrolase